MDIGQLKEYIISYTLNNCPLGNQGYNRVLIQLIGFLGHGKSSLINSCKYALYNKEFTAHAAAGSADGGLTVARNAYPLTDTITMVDNRGCATLNPFETGEFYTQLGNFIPLNEGVEWTKEFGDVVNRLEDSDIEPNFTDIIVPVFVYSVKRELAANEVEEIKTFLKSCRDLTGIFPIIVLTHKTSGAFSKFRDLFEGMGAEEILSVENYTPEDNLKTLGRHLQFLNLIHKVLLNVNFRMSEERNPRRERAERKKFLTRYFHEREVRK
ncbi:uncharacterized protein LOC130283886 [Hyla sarda]|uniref:uncharacterized protein LOC130283886 n=1 Tax=Hyla sarda TaxID=327740 RepID=UPI0024C44DFE|nr:uncharacterized protein LOC130283886 [Hyla sarda]XP_056389512.1 uncharacterized protein LOC130283886 [Hyla sarda]XP_056389513.1 uncharacterized protein LOC130283886 [Hyla sarda]XP_056389514.1 uncharacterized protein LOC130283886 [Hyla sarda]XP_056389516.1 uncharacterized protein LOC130283886 [Hyla sarda]